MANYLDYLTRGFKIPLSDEEENNINTSVIESLIPKEVKPYSSIQDIQTPKPWELVQQPQGPTGIRTSPSLLEEDRALIEAGTKLEVDQPPKEEPGFFSKLLADIIKPVQAEAPIGTHAISGLIPVKDQIEIAARESEVKPSLPTPKPSALSSLLPMPEQKPKIPIQTSVVQQQQAAPIQPKKEEDDLMSLAEKWGKKSFKAKEPEPLSKSINLEAAKTPAGFRVEENKDLKKIKENIINLSQQLYDEETKSEESGQKIIDTLEGKRGSQLLEGLISGIGSAIAPLIAGAVGGAEAGALAAPEALKVSQKFKDDLHKYREQQREAMKVIDNKIKSKALTTRDKIKSLTETFNVLSNIQEKIDRMNIDATKEKNANYFKTIQENRDIFKAMLDSDKFDFSKYKDNTSLGIDILKSLQQKASDLRKDKIELDKIKKEDVKNALHMQDKYLSSDITRNTNNTYRTYTGLKQQYNIAKEKFNDLKDASLRGGPTDELKKNTLLQQKLMLIAVIKMADPGSVAQIGETMNLSNVRTNYDILNNIIDYLNSPTQPLMTEQQIDELKEFADKNWESQLESQKSLYDSYRAKAKNFGMDPNFVLDGSELPFNLNKLERNKTSYDNIGKYMNTKPTKVNPKIGRYSHTEDRVKGIMSKHNITEDQAVNYLDSQMDKTINKALEKKDQYKETYKETINRLRGKNETPEEAISKKMREAKIPFDDKTEIGASNINEVLDELETWNKFQQQSLGR